MTNIVVLIKQVPDYGDRRLSDGDFTLDREGSDAVLDEINEKAVEEALQIKEREGGDSTVTVLTAGPEKATEAIRVLGGYNSAGQAVAGTGADSRGTSVYIQTVAELITSEAGSIISVRGKQDVDVFGLVLAGGSYGDTGATFTLDANGNGGSAIDIQADQQVRLESGLLASGDVRLAGGAPGADDNWNGLAMIGNAAMLAEVRARLVADNPNLNSTQIDALLASLGDAAYNRLSVLINSAGGITAAGLGANGAGSTVNVQAQGRAEIMGAITAGGRLKQTIASGKLVAQSVTWSGRESDLFIETSGRAFVGGTSRNQAGAAVTVAGYLNASRLLSVRGGTDASGTGLLVYGASELAAEGTWEYAQDGTRSRLSTGKTYVNGVIDLYGVNDVRMDGLLLAGGRSEIVTRQGEYVGRQLTHYDVDSEIHVRADRQLIIGTDLTAGKAIELKGGNLLLPRFLHQTVFHIKACLGYSNFLIV
jgi:hypothetical protein